MSRLGYGLIIAIVIMGTAYGADGDLEIQLGRSDGASVLSVANSSSAESFRISDDGMIIGLGALGAGADLAVSGAGTRMIWYPKMAAFRAGHVEGTQWDNGNIGTNSIALGRNTTASGSFSTAVGPANTASGNNAIALGRGNNASGDGSTAIGRESTSSANFAMTLGYQSTASGGGATALGWQTIASGNYSTALGYGAQASGLYSTAMGSETTATGHRSLSTGLGTTAQHYCSTVLGRYNLLDGAAHTNRATVVGTDYLFAVGNGTDDANRSNALTVYNNGDATIAGVITASGTNFPSDRRWKQTVEPIENGLATVTRLTGVSFYWNREEFPHKNFSEDKQIGLIAQDVEAVLPELVHTDPDGYKSVAYAKLTAVLVEAVKELQSQNRALQSQNRTLEERLSRLEAMMTAQ